MNELLMKLGDKQRKGSKPRCHWMTHGSKAQVAARLTRLIAPHGTVCEDDAWMPEGFENTEEAQLHKATRLLDKSLCGKLEDWWLAVARGASMTPNWDIASTCTIYGSKGLMLVEAKAHNEELNKEQAGKNWDEGKASEDSKKNHERIGEAIQSANEGLQKATSLGWNITRDSNYQMSNRFAWSWKLMHLGIPVILVYLGFLKAEEMRQGKKQLPFATHEDWEALVRSHSRRLLPQQIWESRGEVFGQAFVPLIRSVSIAFDEPIAESEA